jgi:hypothetical protein
MIRDIQTNRCNLFYGRPPQVASGNDHILAHRTETETVHPIRPATSAPIWATEQALTTTAHYWIIIQKFE